LKPKNAKNKPCFETSHLGENVMNLLYQKVAQKVTILWATSSFEKNKNELKK
jgi:hypothetical protein